MAVPGSSSVYWGGSIAYNTRNAKPFLLNDETLHNSLLSFQQEHDTNTAAKMSEAEGYIQSKLDWTKKTALAFCNEVGTDYAIAEGGASGPTFRPRGLDRGFCVIAIAARTNGGTDATIVRQEIIQSSNAHRIANMRLFADQAAKLALEVIESNGKQDLTQTQDDDAPTVVEHHLDRATHLRSNEDAMEELAEEAQYVVLYDDQTLFGNDWDLVRLSFEQIQELCETTGATPVATFLGMLDGVEAMFGVDLIGGDSDIIPSVATTISGGAEFGNVRTGAPLLSSMDNELVLHAMALAQWQRRAPYCTTCGSPTLLVDAGTCRECTNTSCGEKTWPRQDPSMIAVITSSDKERVLLGRSLRHPPKMYTALAGFVEAGETFEKAVAREVFEETGVRIDQDSVQYIGSQPWPFPQVRLMNTCMLVSGCHHVYAYIVAFSLFRCFRVS